MKSEESAWMSTFQTNVMGQYFTSSKFDHLCFFNRPQG